MQVSLIGADGAEDAGVDCDDQQLGDRHAAPVAPFQPDLLELPIPSLPAGVPPFTALPEETREALASVLTRMLIAHARGETASPESDDDHA